MKKLVKQINYILLNQKGKVLVRVNKTTKNAEILLHNTIKGAYEELKTEF